MEWARRAPSFVRHRPDKTVRFRAVSEMGNWQRRQIQERALCTCHGGGAVMWIIFIWQLEACDQLRVGKVLDLNRAEGLAPSGFYM